MTAALETIGLEKRFGGLVATNDVSMRLERRRAPRADRPERRRQDDLHQSADGRAGAERGRILLDGEDITALPAHARVRRGLARTFQINQLFADLTPLETVGLAVSERLGHGGDWWRRGRHRARTIIDEIGRHPRPLPARRRR